MSPREGGRHLADPSQDPAPDIRSALERSAGRPPEIHDLLEGVHRKAGRIRRRRRATVTGTLATVLVLGGIAGTTGLVPDLTDEQPVTVDPATTPPAPPPITLDTRPTTPAKATTTARPPKPHTPARDVTTWGKPSLADEFTGSAVNGNLWTYIYTGPGDHSLGNWSPTDVSVTGGALHLRVSRPGGTKPSTSGGVGAGAFARRYGRWEIRWRMTGGQGVIGSFVLNPAGEGPLYGMTVIPYDGLVAANGSTVDGTSAKVSATSWHTATVEWTPTRMRWLIDGRLVTETTKQLPAGPMWPALQAFMAGPDCGATPLPRDCGGRRTTFPQTLDVDWIRYTPYKP